MLNPIDEMRKLSLKSYDELIRIATSNYGFSPNGNRYSKVELITYIVSHAAIHAAYFGDHLENFTMATVNREHERKAYVLEDDMNTYHVMITPEQASFMDWCADKGVNFRCIDIEEPLEIEWEKP